MRDRELKLDPTLAGLAARVEALRDNVESVARFRSTTDEARALAEIGDRVRAFTERLDREIDDVRAFLTRERKTPPRG